MQSLWLLAAGLAFALMGVFVKIASEQFAIAELTGDSARPFVRFIIITTAEQS